MANATDPFTGLRLFTVTYDGVPRWVARAVDAERAIEMCAPMLAPIDRSKPLDQRLRTPDAASVAKLAARESTEEEAGAFNSEAEKITGGEVELAIWPLPPA